MKIDFNDPNLIPSTLMTFDEAAEIIQTTLHSLSFGYLCGANCHCPYTVQNYQVRLDLTDHAPALTYLSTQTTALLNFGMLGLSGPVQIDQASNTATITLTAAELLNCENARHQTCRYLIDLSNHSIFESVING